MPALLLRLPWLLPAVLAALVGMLTIDGEFVMDDRHAIQQSPVVHGQTGWMEAWQRGFWGEPLDQAGDAVSWRPLLPVVWRLLWQLGGGSPLPFRLLTVALHAAATAAVAAALCEALQRSRRERLAAAATPVAVTAGALFAIHGTHAEVVGALVSQADLAAGLFGCLGLRAVFRASGFGSGQSQRSPSPGSCATNTLIPPRCRVAVLLPPCGRRTVLSYPSPAPRERGRPKAGGEGRAARRLILGLPPAQGSGSGSGTSAWPALGAALWFWPAILAKESALLYAFAAIAWLVASRCELRWSGAFVRGLVPAAGVTAAMQAKAFAGRSEGVIDNVLVALHGSDRVVAGLAIAARQAWLSLVPTGLAPSHGYAVYSTDVSGLWPQALAGGAVVLASLGLGLFALVRQRPLLAVGMVLWGGSMVAGSHLLFVGPTELAERLVYPATIATCTALAAVLWIGPGSVALRQLVGVAVAAGLLLATVDAQRAWARPLTLWQRAVEVEPAAWRNQHNLGDALAKSGQIPEGMWHLMVGVWLRRHLPQPVDFRLVEALELLPLQERLVRAAAALEPQDPCGLIADVARKAYPNSQADQAAARRILAQATACEGR